MPVKLYRGAWRNLRRAYGTEGTPPPPPPPNPNVNGDQSNGGYFSFLTTGKSDGTRTKIIDELANTGLQPAYSPKSAELDPALAQAQANQTAAGDLLNQLDFGNGITEDDLFDIGGTILEGQME